MYTWYTGGVGVILLAHFTRWSKPSIFPFCFPPHSSISSAWTMHGPRLRVLCAVAMRSRNKNGYVDCLFAIKKELYAISLFLTCCCFHLGCFRNELISLDRKLLPLTNIRALHADQLAYPVENIVESSMVWCSTAGNGGVNYVNMTFSKPVVLEGLISHGATSNMGTIQHYVSGFSILYSKAENGSLQLYPSVCCFL